MNKKISVLTIALTGFFGFSALAAEVNLGKEESDNTTSQGNINTLRNIEQPKTPLTAGVIGATENSLTKKDEKNLNSTYGWGSSPLGTNMIYEVDCPNCKKTGEAGREDAGLLRNCPKNRVAYLDGKPYCKGVDVKCYCATSDVNNNACRNWEGQIDNGECSCTVADAKSKGNGCIINENFKGIFVNSDVYTKTTEGYVSFDDKMIQTNDDDPSIPRGFYRYYITTDKSEYNNNNINANDGKHPCEIEEGRLGGCWSPLYPIVNFSGFAGIKNGLLKAESDENARKNYFGARTQYPIPRLAEEANQYSDDKQPSKKAFAYRMGVKVAAVTENGVPTGTIPNNASTISKSNLSASSSNGTPVVLSVQRWNEQTDGVGAGALNPDFNLENLGYNTKLGNNNIKTKVYKNKTISNLSEVFSKDAVEEDVLPCGMFNGNAVGSVAGVRRKEGVECMPEYMRIQKDNKGNPLYTKFRVALPTNTGYESNYTKDLNYRTCARCSGLNSETNCYDFLTTLIEKNNINSLDALVARLRERFDNQSVSSGGIDDYGSYSGTFTCATCLGQLDTLLGGDSASAVRLRGLLGL